jgi:hypothetical protein
VRPAEVLGVDRDVDAVAEREAMIDGVVTPMLETSPPFSEGLFDSSARIFNNRGQFLEIVHDDRC